MARLSFFLFVCLFSLSLSLSVSLPVYSSLSNFLSLYLFMCVCLSLSLFLALALPISPCLLLSFYLSLFITLCLSVSLSLFSLLLFLSLVIFIYLFQSPFMLYLIEVNNFSLRNETCVLQKLPQRKVGLSTNKVIKMFSFSLSLSHSTFYQLATFTLLVFEVIKPGSSMPV